MSQLNKRIMRMIFDAKGQNLAIAMVVAIGLMFYVAMSTAITNLDHTVNQYYQITNAADIYIEIPKINSSDVDRLQNISGVDDAEGRIVKDVRYINQNNEKVTLRVISLSQKENQINSLFFHTKKSQLNSGKEAFLIQSFTKARQIDVGDPIKIQYAGSDSQFELKGIVSSSEFIYLMENEQSLLPDFKKFGILYVEEDYALNTFSSDGLYNQVLVKVKNGYDPEIVKKAIEKKLETKGVQRVYVRSDQLSSRMVQEEINGNKKTSGVIPIFFLGIASAIMYVMIARMVRNDKLSIGILKSLGFSNRKIITHYCLYAVSVGIFGAVIGVTCGSFMSAFITKMYAEESFNIPILSYEFSAYMLVSSIVISMIFSISAGILGARGVIKVDPAIAMRPDAPATGRSIYLEKTKIWQYLSFTEKMVIRNTLRHKMRIFFVSLGIGLTFVVIMMPIFLTGAFIGLFDFQYAKMQKMDYNLVLSEFGDESLVKSFKEIEGVTFAEGKLEYPFEIKKGYLTKITNIIGLKSHTQMYTFYDAKTNQKIEMSPEKVLISEGLAKVLDVGVGSEIQIESYMPDQAKMAYRITDVVKQNLGANIYLPLQRMQQDFFDAGVINGVYLEGDPSVKESLLRAKTIGTILSIDDIKNAYKDFMQLTYISIGMMVIFGVILGIAIVYNAIIMTMNERATEIASMRVLGMTINEIFSIFIREIMLTSVIGILMGIPMGYYSLKGIMDAFSNDLYSLSAEIGMNAYVQTTVITLMAIGISLALSYRKVSKSNFIDALKNRVT